MVSEVVTALVVDTNIIFSTLQKEGITRKLFFLLGVEFYAPNFLMVEIIKYKEKIVSLSPMNESEFISVVSKVFNKINFVNETLISVENRKKAYEMCKDIDETDTPFVALALELNIPLWSGDKKLVKGLKIKKFNKVLTTEDIKKYL